MVFSEQGLGCGVGPPNAQFVMSPPYGGERFFQICDEHPLVGILCVKESIASISNAYICIRCMSRINCMCLLLVAKEIPTAQGQHVTAVAQSASATLHGYNAQMLLPQELQSVFQLSLLSILCTELLHLPRLHAHLG